jgi:tRNA 2-thiouridine synthesizing protein A
MEVRWDAGEMGCGALVLELHKRVSSLASGDILRLVAHDPGAPVDLPAWCRMTGNILTEADHPSYVIRIK